jgi:hypothetical protein
VRSLCAITAAMIAARSEFGRRVMRLTSSLTTSGAARVGSACRGTVEPKLSGSTLTNNT